MLIHLKIFFAIFQSYYTRDILINLSISNSVIYHLTSSYCVQSDNYSRAINLVFPSKKYSLARVTLGNFTSERDSKNDRKGY